MIPQTDWIFNHVPGTGRALRTRLGPPLLAAPRRWNKLIQPEHAWWHPSTNSLHSWWNVEGRPLTEADIAELTDARRVEGGGPDVGPAPLPGSLCDHKEQPLSDGDRCAKRSRRKSLRHVARAPAITGRIFQIQTAIYRFYPTTYRFEGPCKRFF